MNIDTDIRVAGPDDYQEIFRICCLLHHENGQFAFNELKVRELIWRGVQRERAIIGVIGPSDDIKAMILLNIEEVIYSSDLEIVERWNYVRPDSRRSDYAKQMIDFAKKCAKSAGIPLCIGIISQKRLEAKRRLYEKMLPIGGYWFIYDPLCEEHNAPIPIPRPWLDEGISRREYKRRMVAKAAEQ